MAALDPQHLRRIRTSLRPPCWQQVTRCSAQYGAGGTSALRRCLGRAPRRLQGGGMSFGVSSIYRSGGGNRMPHKYPQGAIHGSTVITPKQPKAGRDQASSGTTSCLDQALPTPDTVRPGLPPVVEGALLRRAGLMWSWARPLRRLRSERISGTPSATPLTTQPRSSSPS